MIIIDQNGEERSIELNSVEMQVLELYLEQELILKNPQKNGQNNPRSQETFKELDEIMNSPNRGMYLNQDVTVGAHTFKITEEWIRAHHFIKNSGEYYQQNVENLKKQPKNIPSGSTYEYEVWRQAFNNSIDERIEKLENLKSKLDKGVKGNMLGLENKTYRETSEKINSEIIKLMEVKARDFETEKPSLFEKVKGFLASIGFPGMKNSAATTQAKLKSEQQFSKDDFKKLVAGLETEVDTKIKTYVETAKVKESSEKPHAKPEEPSQKPHPVQFSPERPNIKLRSLAPEKVENSAQSSTPPHNAPRI